MMTRLQVVAVLGHVDREFELFSCFFFVWHVIMSCTKSLILYFTIFCFGVVEPVFDGQSSPVQVLAYPEESAHRQRAGAVHLEILIDFMH